MATLSSCVQEILCGLSAGVLAALQNIINGYVGVLETQIDFLTGKLIYLDILTAPPALLQSIIEEALVEAKAAANIIPLDLIGSCVDIGNLNLAIQNNINILLADVNAIALDLERLLSFKDAIAAEILELKNAIDIYAQILVSINLCAQIQSAVS